jgi:Late embryogenesis abundant protein
MPSGGSGLNKDNRGPLCLLLLLPLALTSCLSYQEVSFKGITDVDVSSFDNNGVSARVMVTLDNPNAFRIHVIDPDVDLFLNDVYIGKATLDSNLVLEKRTTKDYAVPLHASFDGHGTQAMGAMFSAALSGQAKLKAKGSVVGKAFFLRKRFPFEEEHEFKLGE